MFIYFQVREDVAEEEQVVPDLAEAMQELEVEEKKERKRRRRREEDGGEGEASGGAQVFLFPGDKAQGNIVEDSIMTQSVYGVRILSRNIF